MYHFRIRLAHGHSRYQAICRHNSGGEALAEVCEALGIIYPSHASIVRLP
jgi:hypothetical protein